MKKHSILQRFSFAAAPVVALLLGGVAHQTQAQLPPSPVDDWDFYFSGVQKGVAQITFLGDFTLTGIQIHMPGKKPKSSEVNPRGSTVDPENPRGDSGSPAAPLTLHYGGAVITGNWGYDFNGKLVGAITLTSTKLTNGLSFKGTVVPGKRMTLLVSRDGAGSVFHGVPRAVIPALPDISGDYFLSGKKGRLFFTEILALAPSGLPNNYDLTRHGPGYDGDGFVILTANKRLGFYGEHFMPGTTNLVITALSGAFNTTKLKGRLAGYDGTNSFNVTIGNP